MKSIELLKYLMKLDFEGKKFPTQQELGNRFGVSRVAIWKNLRRLVDWGHIVYLGHGDYELNLENTETNLIYVDYKIDYLEKKVKAYDDYNIKLEESNMDLERSNNELRKSNDFYKNQNLIMDGIIKSQQEKLREYENNFKKENRFKRIMRKLCSHRP